MKLRELQEKRAKLIAENRALLDAAEKEERQLTSEEQTQYDERFNKQEELRATIDREVKQRELDKQAIELRQAKPDNDAPPTPPQQPTAPDSDEYRSIRDRYLRGEQMNDTEVAAFRAGGSPEEDRRSTPEYQKAFRSWLAGRPLADTERRALQVDLDASGGYIVAPEQFVATLIKAVDNLTFVRQFATKFSVPNAQSLGAPALDADPADPTWVSEITTGSEDSTMTFGKRDLYPHPLAQYIKVSKTLLRKSSMGAEALVRERLAYKIAVVQENAFLNGSGANQPLGVFTASSTAGISTDRDVSTDNTTTAFTADGLINTKYSIKGQYWPRLRWIMHRDAVKMAAKLKDGEGQYLWKESMRVGEPDRLNGFPIHMSEYAPNTFTTGLYVGILGDFSNYWIADALDTSIQAVRELYAATNQDAFFSRSETDGMPVLEEAFARVKLA